MKRQHGIFHELGSAPIRLGPKLYAITVLLVHKADRIKIGYGRAHNLGCSLMASR